MNAFKTLVLCTLLWSAQAHAGFLTGFVVGSAVSESSSGSSQSSGSGRLLASDSHDVIMCPQIRNKPGYCYTDEENAINERQKWSDKKYVDKWLTPEEFASRMGYKKLVRRGVFVFPSGSIYTVMEVEK